MNALGLVAALTAFFSIWFGHVAVRKVESISPSIWIPATIFGAFGLAVEYLSLTTVSRPLSVAFGIVGLTLLWDAIELSRQQQRIIKGHAPANLNNPRHVKIVAQHTTATIHDLLKRDPLGHSVADEEIPQFVSTL